VRLLRIRVRHFGPLRELDSGDEELPGLVAVLGPNEAGKSSLHQAMVSLLYGFYPATRDAHELAPWSGESPELTGWIRTREEASVQVHRRLLSRPDGTLTRGETLHELRNHELPFVRHVTQKVFEQVYAITLSDLAGLDDEGWGAVQDRLVVGMGSSDLRSPREAAAELAGEAHGLWRPTQHGNFRDKELRAELTELNERRQAARQRDREVRELDRRLHEMEAELERLRSRREEAQEVRARAARLRPLARRLDEIRRLARTAGALEELADLPPDPRSTLSDLAERLDEADGRCREVGNRLADAREAAQGPAPEEEAMLSRAGELRSLADRAAVLPERAVVRRQREAELAAMERRIRSSAAPLMADGTLPTADMLARLPIPTLRRELDELRRRSDEAEDIRSELDRARSAAPEVDDEPRPMRAVVGLGVGLLLLAGGLLLGLTDALPVAVVVLLLLVGGPLAGWGGWTLARWRLRREMADEAARARHARVQELEHQEREATRRLEKAQAAVRERLEPVPLRGEVLAAPAPELAGDLERLRDLVLDAEDRREALSELREDDQALEAELAAVRAEFEALSDLPSDPLEALPEVSRRLAEVTRQAETARRAAGECRRLEEELAEAEARRNELARREEELDAALRRAGGEAGSLEEALRRVEERLEARAALRREEARLEREEGGSELGTRQELEAARRDGAEWLDDPDVLRRLDREVAEQSRRIEDLRGDVETVRARIRELDRQETLDLVEGRIEAAREELGRVAIERDRLFALSRIIQVAERRFRDEHQPDLLQRAGAHLRTITGGRYSRLLMAQEEGDAPVALDGGHLSRPVQVAAPISTGTREQAYLSLRLAIVDHLDEGHEPLPLSLDEVLVNWDPDRRSRGLGLLARAAQDRQVFLFTCHPDLARAVESHGGRVLELPSPEGPS
jgi:uncharacterized protein YhaN